MARSHLRHVVTDKAGNVISNAAVFVGEPPEVESTLPVISGKIVHLDATTLGLSEGALISSWTDLSGNSNHAVGAGLHRPTFHTSGGSDNLPYVEFIRGDVNNFDQLIAPIPASATRTFFFVVRKRTPPGAITNGNVLASLGGNRTEIVDCNTFFGVGYQYYHADDGVEVGVKLFGGNPTDWNILAVKFTSSSVAAGYVNDAQPVSFDPDVSYATGTQLKLVYGLDVVSGGLWSGDYNIHEVLLYDSALSEDNISDVIAHLQTKYNIVSDALVGSMFEARIGSSTLSNPLISNDKGEIEAWLESPQRVDVVVTDNGDRAYYPSLPDQPVAFEDFVVTVHSEDSQEPDNGIFYVRPDGDNANDGTTWKTAKEDILGAIDASTGSPYIYFHTGSYIDAAHPTRGLWMMDQEDTQWNDGEMLPGWRSQRGFKIVGVGGTTLFGREPRALLHGGDPLSRDRPAVWMSHHTNQGNTFENVQFDYLPCPVRLAIDSDGTSTAATAGFDFLNCQMSCNQSAISGPAVEMGYIFWTSWKNNCFVTGPQYGWTITEASITAGTTARFTLSEAHALIAGDTVQIEEMDPVDYNSASSDGTGVNPDRQWRVTNVSDDTHFDVDIEASPAAATISGDERMWPLQSHRRQAFGYRHTDLVDRYGGPSPIGPGLLEFANLVTVGGFSYHTHPSNLIGVIRINEMTSEGGTGSEPPMTPPLLHLKTDPGEPRISGFSAGVVVNATNASDALNTSGSVLVDGELTDPGIVQASNSEVRGNHTGWGPFINLQGGSGPPYRREDITGSRGGLLLGKSDFGRRMWTPHAVPFVNRAKQDPADWGAPGGTAVLTTVRDPAGGMRAGRIVAGATPGSSGSLIGTGSVTYAVGDWVMIGVWKRSLGTRTAQSSTSEMVVLLGASVTTWEGTNSPMESNSAPAFADGGWEWNSTRARITASSGAKTMEIDLVVPANQSTEFYGPVVVHIPAAEALSNGEISELFRNLGSWPETAPRGDMAFGYGQNLHLPENYIDIGVITPPAAPASDFARVYVDTTGGKDRLMVRFNSGAVQMIATEP